MNKNKEIILDIREVDEYNAEYIEWSLNIPMSLFESNEWLDWLRNLKWNRLVILCRSWARAHISEWVIRTESLCDDISVYEWWIIKWKEEWKPVKQTKANHLPVSRQVQILIWVLIFLTLLLMYLISYMFFHIFIVMWILLIYAWITWNCVFYNFIERMPNNKFMKALRIKK